MSMHVTADSGVQYTGFDTLVLFAMVLCETSKKASLAKTPQGDLNTDVIYCFSQSVSATLGDLSP
jgi:hypothetical protein